MNKLFYNCTKTCNEDCSCDITNIDSEAANKKLGLYLTKSTLDIEQAFFDSSEWYDDLYIGNKKKNINNWQNELLTYFCTKMEHEFRTPLNWILWTMSILESTILNNMQKHLVETSKSSAELFLILIDNFVNLSQIELWTLQLESDSVNIPSIIKECWILMKNRLKNKNIELISNVWENIPLFLWDQKKNLQVIINLLSNALKYTNHWSIELDCNYRNNKLTIWIKDTWIWLSQEDLKEIFHEFSFTKERYSMKYGWSWLWMIISKYLIDKMWWELKWKSEKWVWSEFYFTIPVSEVKHSKNEKQIEDKYINTDHIKTFWKDKKILVVDDNETQHFICQGLFKNYKIYPNNIYSAYSGKEAIDMIKEYDFDLVLMDNYMANMNGVEAMLQIRKIENKKDVTIIVCTWDSDIPGWNYIQKWFDWYIQKPIYFNSTMSYITMIVKNKHEILLKKMHINNLTLSDLKILIAYNDYIDWVITKKILKNKWLNKNNICIINNWQEVIEEIRNWDYNIILMDNNMKSKNFLWAIRQFSSIPIII